MSQPYITLDRQQWRQVHNALCKAEQEARQLFDMLKDGGRARDALEAIREALKPAYQQDNDSFNNQHEYFERTRKQKGYRAIWSMYDETGVGDFYTEHPFSDATSVYYDQHWGGQPITEPIRGPLWIDLYDAADRAIRASGDDHHIYVEGFRPALDEPTSLRLVTGS